MLLEIFTKTENGTENSRYVSVTPESLQIKRNPEFIGKSIPADANPHVLTFIGKPMSCLNKNVEPYSIPLTTDMAFRLLTEKGEKRSKLNLQVFVDEKPSTLFEDIKIQRNEGLIYRATFNRILLGIKYKKIVEDRVPAGRHYTANLELFNRWSTTLSTLAGAVKEIRLIKA